MYSLPSFHKNTKRSAARTDPILAAKIKREKREIASKC